MRIPYTYILESTDGHLYVGSKYGVDANPENLLKTYFTSSKYARPLILEDVSKWKIIRLQEGKTTEEVVAREMDWQREFRHNKGMLNKSINRAQGKFVNYGPKSDETRRKISNALKGKPISTKTIEAARLANTGRKCPEHVKNILRETKIGVPRNIEVRKRISATMSANRSSVGSKNANTTTWVLRDPSGVMFNQPANLTGRAFIESLGLSYQMLIKFRKDERPFSGNLTGWEIISCSRPKGQKHNLSGIRSASH